MAAELNLTTLERVLQYIDAKAADVREGGKDSLQGMVSAVSTSIANLCNSDFSVKARTERRILAKPTFIVTNGPARSITSIRYNPSRAMTVGSVVVQPTGYEIDPDGGRIYLGPCFIPGMQWEVAYTGGRFYTTNSSQFSAVASGAVQAQQHVFADGRKLTITAWDSVGGLVTFTSDAGSFREGESLTLTNGTVLSLGSCVKPSVCNDGPDLEQACLMQVSNLWQRHKSLGRTSTDIGNGASQFVKDYDLLPGVKTLLTRYARPWSIG